MKTQIANAFAALNAKIHAADQAFVIAKLEGFNAAMDQAKADFKAGKYPAVTFTSGYGRFDHSMAATAYFGSAAMQKMIAGHGRATALENMSKNTAALIESRDSKIIAALSKAGISEIPEFELSECSDGLEGSFNVAGHIVTIRTILAGGYNIQRLHNRTVTKIR